MIRVHRPIDIPETLKTLGAKATKRLCQSYDSGERTFSFRNDIYGATEVKAALKQAQHLKCCFCERLVGDDGHVEHFRPKAAFCQNRGDELSDSGYYWLAYEWTNLLLSCSDCNVRHKGNLFPLESEDARAANHSDSITTEKPLFINPAEEDPEAAIEWVEFEPRPVAGHKRADATLTALRLNGPKRDGLSAARRQHFLLIRTVLEVIFLYRNEPSEDVVSRLTEAEKVLEEMASPRGIYSAMVRALLQREGFRF